MAKSKKRSIQARVAARRRMADRKLVRKFVRALKQQDAAEMTNAERHD
jgi:hypothetical protein